MVKGQLGKRAYRGDRIQVIDIELPLGVPGRRVGTFQDRDVQLFLACEVVIDHPLRGARSGSDLVDPRSRVAVRGELGERHVQDLLTRSLRVALSPRSG